MTRLRLTLESLDDRLVPAAPLSSYLSSLSAPPSQEIAFAVGSDVGGDSTIKLFNAGGHQLGQRLAFGEGFRGGVKTAVGDVTGDGVNDVIAAAGLGGGPAVRVFDGKTGLMARNFFAYPEGYTGGVNVAAADVNGDGAADIVTGTEDGGGPAVRVFDGRTLVMLHNFYAYPTGYTGGVHVAAGDVTGDGAADIVTGTGAGGGPAVRVWDGAGGALTSSFFVLPESFTAGVHVAAGDVSGDGVADIVVAPGTGGGPVVRVFDAAGGLRTSFYTQHESARYGTPITVTAAVGTDPAVIVAGNGPGGVGHISGFKMNGNSVFGLTAFPHQEGVSFGSGSGFPISHTDMQRLLEWLRSRGREWEDGYDLDEVLAYFWEDSERIDDDVTDDILDGLGYIGILGW